MKLGGIYIGVRAKTDKYKRDLANAKTMTQKAAVRIQHSISSISFAQVGIAAAAFGAVMTKVGLDGFKAVEQLNLSTASLASTITSFAKNAGTDLAGTYKQAYEYSGQLVLKMEEWNAKTVATGANLTAMVETLAQSGVLLDLNNKEQEKGFLAIANALALMTQGQNQDIQFRQEIRGLVQGEVRATNLLSRLLSQRVGGALKKHVELWKQQGTLIENAGALLEGFQEGAKDLQNTWIAVGTTLETMYNRTLRGMFTPFYKDIIKMGKEITLNALDQNSALNRNADILRTVVYKGWLDIKNVTQSIADIILAFKDPLLLIGNITGLILDGWGQIFAILPAITKSFKLITQAVFDSVKMIGHFAAALWKATSFDFKGAAESISMAKSDWIESGRKTGEAFGSGFIDEFEKRMFEYNKKLNEAGTKKVTAPELKKLSGGGKNDKDVTKAFEAMSKARLNAFYEDEKLRSEKWQREIEASNREIALEKETEAVLAQSRLNAFYEDEKLRSEKWQAEIEASNRLIENEKEFEARFEEIGLTQFEFERLQVARTAEMYENAGIDRVRVAEMTAKKIKEIARQEQMAKVTMYQSAAGGIADTFKQIADAGAKQSKAAFKMYKAFAMVEAAIAGYKAVLNAMAAYPPPMSFVMAGIAGAAASVQIGMIAASQPPSYDQGGISSARGIYQTGDISEAHIPIPSGGKIPVKVEDKQQQAPTVNVIMNNPVFQDIATQRQVFSQIASEITARLAPKAVLDNYNNDGAMRSLIRGRA